MNREKILLLILPLWDPLIPPLGISCLKSYLRQQGHRVTAADANVRPEFNKVSADYLKKLQGYVPVDKRGNFINIANTVMEKHLMAHLNQTDEKEYGELVRILVYQAFFCHIDDSQVMELKNIITRFYSRLEGYLINLLGREKPTVLGISVYSATAPASLFAFRLAKEMYPLIRTVMGGGIFSGDLAVDSPNFNFFLEKTPYIDCIIVGEGEILFSRYLEGQLTEGQRVYTREDIGGETLDFDCLDIPDFSDFDLRYYPNLAAYSSRSCPYNCAFCSEVVLWGKYRKKEADDTVNELIKLHKKHERQLFLMSDSLLNPVITDLANALIDSGASIYWDGYLRVDRAAGSTENTLLWRRGGFYRARLGLESGSERVLKSMSKKIMPTEMEAVLASLAYAGIKTTTYWIVGYPGETEEDFRQTLDFIDNMKDYIYEADCNPFVYYLTGQKNSARWNKENQSAPLYPEKARDMLIMQSWFLDGEPSREEVHRRLNRFADHCRKLGIPNPYSKYDIYQADERWKRLHKNAVPALVDFETSHSYFTENKRVKKLQLVEQVVEDGGDFDF